MGSCIQIVFNEFTFDSRVKKISAEASSIFETTVYCFSEKKDTYSFQQDGYRVEKIGLIFRQLRNFSSIRHVLAYFEFFLKLVCKINFLELKVIHVHDLKPMALGILFKYFTFGKARLIYDCHEYETEIGSLNGKYFKKKILKFYENILVHLADEVITVSDKISEEYSRLYSIAKPTVILNCPPYNSIPERSNIFREKFHISEDKKIFLYQGALVRGRGVEETILAFEMVCTDHVLVFMGYGELEDYIKEKAKLVSNVFFHPAVSQKDLMSYTSSADFGICFAPNFCLSYDYSLSNKIFEYTQARIPIISSNLSEIRRYIETNNLGFVIYKDDYMAISDVIFRALKVNLNHFKENLNKAAAEYNWEKQAVKLCQIYTKLS